MLGIPGEIRNQIYRLALLEPDDIDVSRAGSRLEPGLLRCCRAIRTEAMDIFCGENTFVITVYNRRPSANLHHWIWNGHVTPGERVRIKDVGKPSWSGLKAWLKTWREGQVHGVPQAPKGDHAPIRTFGHAFELSRTMSGVPWEQVEAALQVFKDVVENFGTNKIFEN